MSMFVGYSEGHAGDTYRMLNQKTGRVMVTRNVRWLQRLYKDEDPTQSRLVSWNDTGDEAANEVIEAREDEQEVTTVREPEAEEVDDNEDASMNPRVMRALRTLHTSYNPTLKDVVDFAFVGGTMEGHQNPVTFQEAWHHPDEHERSSWQAAIRKEFKDMISKGVWRYTKTSKVPSDRRLIGCKWVFKVKGNGVYRARLCALGYSQIPGVDHQDNFAPVITDVTFRIVLLMMMMNGWDAYRL